MPTAAARRRKDSPRSAVPDSMEDIAVSLRRSAEDPSLLVPPRVDRHEPGDRLTWEITGVEPAVRASAVFEVERFVGGGFAGQVYRMRLVSLAPRAQDSEPIPSLRPGRSYAVKILVPPGRFALWFRNILYRIGFQAPFLPQLHRASSRAGVLWQKVIRHAARVRLGGEEAVADTYATFFDERLRSFGEINEWVEGRMWRFAVDDALCRRRRALRGGEEAVRRHPAAEYLAKRIFMRRLVDLLSETGADELRRQYEWSTCKSQPNVLKRVSAGRDPFAGLTAIDFRAGLVLLPFLPMSPGDFRLIFRGLLRGRLVQFDRGDLRRLDRFVAENPHAFAGHEALLRELRTAEMEYREARPDWTHHGLRLFWSRRLRRAVRSAYVESWIRRGLITPERARLLRRNLAAYLLYYWFGAVPFAGAPLRRLWGDPIYGRHVGRILSDIGYAAAWMRAARAAVVRRWHRKGRVGDRHAAVLLRNPLLFWIERILLGWLPFPSWHRALAEPAWVWAGMRNGVLFIWKFYKDNEFREKWLRAEVRIGVDEGMLTPPEAEQIVSRVKEPFIQKYLQSLAVHFCTLPATQIVGAVVAAVVGHRVYTGGGSAAEAAGTAVGVLGIFQVLPISPGSLLRGLYVVYVMIRDRNFRDYAWALPISFLHYVGYLAFPIQMVVKYPLLSRFMAGRWATHLVRIVPVFGERGALLEYAVFNTFFNVPVSLRAYFRRRKARESGPARG